MGDPVAIAQDVVTTIGGGAFDVSENGTLIFLTDSSAFQQLVAIRRDGTMRPLAAAVREAAAPRVSPDGRRIALDIQVPRPDVWLYDLQSRALSKLTTAGNACCSKWTRDGQFLAFVANDSGENRIKRQRWNRSDTANVYLDDAAASPWEISFGPPGGYSVLRADRRGSDPGTDLFSSCERTRRA